MPLLCAPDLGIAVPPARSVALTWAVYLGRDLGIAVALPSGLIPCRWPVACVACPP